MAIMSLTVTSLLLTYYHVVFLENSDLQITCTQHSGYVKLYQACNGIHYPGVANQSPDFSPVENLWLDFKMAVHIQSPCELTKLEQLFQIRMEPRCAGLIETNSPRVSHIELKGVNIHTITHYVF